MTVQTIHLLSLLTTSASNVGASNRNRGDSRVGLFRYDRGRVLARANGDARCTDLLLDCLSVRSGDEGVE